MCGIVAVARRAGGAVDGELLLGMADALAHRGPDDAGSVIRGSAGLAFRRLSIIDLVTGHQPLASEDGSVWIVFNGEVYNFRELRAELEARGHVFATGADTEVVVHGYEEWGERVVERLGGMFAFVLLDVPGRRLFGARDRMGKKPFYYAPLDGGGIAVASELKALLKCPGWDASLDPASLARYLCFEFVPDPRTIYRGARKLPPGHAMSWSLDSGELRAWRWWGIGFDRTRGRIGEREACGELVRLVDAAVARRLVADVPLGVFLSGGIDSSFITAMMARHLPASSIKTFTIGFGDPSFDESPHARAVARRFGTDHHEETLDPAALVELMPAVADIVDEPLGDASIVPTYLLAKFARRTVTVALGGDGGDELFAGYPTFWADRVARAADRAVPRRLLALAARAADALPVSLANFSPDFVVKQFLRGASLRGEERHQAWLGSFLPAEALGLLAPALRREAGAPYDDIAAAMGGLEGASAQDRLLFFYCAFYLGGDILVKTDRASMAASLECRAPFLDREVVEFACSLPPRLRLRPGRTKYLMRKAMEGFLPPDIVARPKKGFGIPVGRWLKGPLRGWMERELAPDKLRREGVFDPDAVARLVAEHLSGRRDQRKKLWTLLVFERWLARWGGAS